MNERRGRQFQNSENQIGKLLYNAKTFLAMDIFALTVQARAGERR
ncbi:MAG TPA: hypothetical protein VF735_17255 [Pyrinomonadaceae bacterium]